MEPRYIHDCDGCEFVGQDGEYDMYRCHVHGSLIARYGDDGPDYSSMQPDLALRLDKHNGPFEDVPQIEAILRLARKLQGEGVV